jgi:hypothetical protein
MMMNQKVVFYFLLVVFILLVLSTIFKVYIQGKLIRETFTAGDVNSETKTESDEIKHLRQTYQSEISALTDKIDELQNKLSDFTNESVTLKNNIDTSRQEFSEEAEKMKSSLQAMGDFHDSYSQELQRLLQNQLNYTDPAFQARQEIQESRIKSLENEISQVEVLRAKVQKKKDNLLRSIICRANSTKLNVQPIMAGANPTGRFVIYLNDRCLAFSQNGSQVEVKVNGCDLSDTTQAFELKQINNFIEYNNAIKAEEKGEKRLVMKNDDIFYPFYLVQPAGTPGKCLYVSDENQVYIKTVEASANCRFRTSDTFAYGSCDRN